MLLLRLLLLSALVTPVGLSKRLSNDVQILDSKAMRTCGFSSNRAPVAGCSSRKSTAINLNKCRVSFCGSFLSIRLRSKMKRSVSSTHVFALSPVSKSNFVTRCICSGSKDAVGFGLSPSAFQSSCLGASSSFTRFFNLEYVDINKPTGVEEAASRASAIWDRNAL